MKKRLIKLMKDYAALYEEGLVGLAVNYVQVTPELFKELAGVNDIETENDEGFIRLTCTVDGTKFLTLL